MISLQRLSDCPLTLEQGDANKRVVWYRDLDYVARPDEDVSELFHLVRIDEAGDRCCPVYRQQPGTTPAVATGKLFLHVQNDWTIDMLEARLMSLGLRVSKLLSWAPNAAWIVALDGTPCHALARLPELHKLDGVAHAEAQLLLQLKHR